MRTTRIFSESWFKSLNPFRFLKVRYRVVRLQGFDLRQVHWRVAIKAGYLLGGNPKPDFMATETRGNPFNHLDVEYITIHSSNRRETDMKWQKGQSGNPAGRPKECIEVRKYILQKTNSGKELVDLMYKVAFNKDSEKHTGWAAKERLVAIKWLSDYSLGRPTENLDLTGDGQKLGLVEIVAHSRKIEKEEDARADDGGS